MSDSASTILTKVGGAIEDHVNAVRIAKSLRKQTTATRAAMVMEQAQLRIRARRKFSRADQMFFTRRGLEQATGRRLAAYKARRLRGLPLVADVCCGIGGDLIAIAKRNAGQPENEPAATETIGVDLDELTCLFARRNLEVNSIEPDRVEVRNIDFSEFEMEQLNALHIDPDRRTEDRTVHGNRFSPRLQAVFERVSPHCSAVVKVAPATPGAEYFPVQMQREWIGDHRECKQQLLWLGPATDLPGHRTATYVGKRGVVSQVSIAETEFDQTVEVFDTIHAFVFEPHPTVLAAKLTDVLARQYELRRFNSSIVYLTGNQPVDDPLLTQFEVLEIVPLNLRKVAEVLRGLDVGEIEVKRRGVEEVIAGQVSRLKLNGTRRATVILTRRGRSRIAIIAKRKKNPLVSTAS